MNVVIVNCFDTYEERTELVKSFFQRKGDNVKVITSNFLHIKKEYNEKERPDYFYIEVKSYYRNISFRRARSHMGFSQKVTEVLPEFKPEIIYALVPPNCLVKSVAEYKKMHPGVKVIFDLVDLWPETMPVSFLENSVLLKPWTNIRNNFLNAGDYVITECDLYQKRLKGILNPDKTKTVYLARKQKNIIVQDNTKDGKMALCYLGSVNNVADIESIGHIISSFSKEKIVEMHFIGEGEKKEELLHTARKNGARVFDYGIIYDAEKKQSIFNRCNYGLNLMKTSSCVGLTMKSIDYFEGGLPIINNIPDDTWNLVETCGIGINYKKGQALPSVKIDKAHVHDIYEQYFIEDVFYEQLEEVYSVCLA